MMSMGYITFCIDAKWPDKQPRHCFKIPEFVDAENFKKPEPVNMPPLELAATVLSLVEFAEQFVHDKALTSELTEVANRYIQKVREGLPEGVEIKRVKATQAAAASR